jgi:hypothetical protein
MDPVLVNLVKMPSVVKAAPNLSPMGETTVLQSSTEFSQANSSPTSSAFDIRQQYLTLAAFIALCAVSLYTANERIPKFHVCLMLLDFALYGYTTTQFWHEYQRRRTHWSPAFPIKAILIIFCLRMLILEETDPHIGRDHSWIGGWESFVLCGYSIVETVVRIGVLQGITR